MVDKLYWSTKVSLLLVISIILFDCVGWACVVLYPSMYIILALPGLIGILKEDVGGCILSLVHVVVLIFTVILLWASYYSRFYCNGNTAWDFSFFLLPFSFLFTLICIHDERNEDGGW